MTGQHRYRCCTGVFPDNPYLSLLGTVKTVEVFDQRGFAGAISPDNCHPLTCVQIEMNTVQHPPLAGGEREIAHAEQWRSVCRARQGGWKWIHGRKLLMIDLRQHSLYRQRQWLQVESTANLYRQWWFEMKLLNIGGQNLNRRPIQHNLTIVQHDHTGRIGGHQPKPMLGNDDRHSLLMKPAQDSLHLRHMPAIEIGKRFIEDNDPRPHGQNTRQRYQKLLTGGELLRMSRKQMLDAEPTGDFVDTLPDFCRCIPQTFQPKAISRVTVLLKSCHCGC